MSREKGYCNHPTVDGGVVAVKVGRGGKSRNTH